MLPTILPLMLVVLAPFATYSDVNFSTQATKYAAGETIYFKVDSSSGGDKTNKLTLLDENKNEVATYPLARSGGANGYSYTSQFAAPGSAGTYYIDVKLDDGRGKVFSGQRNITVTGSIQAKPTATITPTVTSAPTVVKSIAPTSANVFKQKEGSITHDDNFEEGSTPASPDEQKEQREENIVEKFILLIKNFFSSLF